MGIDESPASLPGRPLLQYWSSEGWQWPGPWMRRESRFGGGKFTGVDLVAARFFIQKAFQSARSASHTGL
jgi:hypothetical protein